MKEVSFEAGGKTRSLRFDINAMCRYQDVSGESLNKMIEGMQSDPQNMVRARRVFWASLTDRKDGITQEDAGDIMQSLGAVASMDAVMQAVVYALQDINGTGDHENPTEPRSETAAI